MRPATTLFRTMIVALCAVLAACATVPKPAAGAARFTDAQVAVLKQHGFEQVGDSWQLGLGEKLLFPVDQARLAAEQEVNLARLASELTAVGILGARVEGHTDSTGSAGYNRQLSVRRAEAVKSAMVSGGMRREAVRALGRGKTDPIATNRTRDGRQENRRVVILVTPADLMRLQ